MIYWNNLPIEVLSLVFESKANCGELVLSRQDLLQCELVCSQWRSPARRAKYVDIKLEASRAELFTARFDQQYGNHVKRLSIEDVVENSNEGESLRQAIEISADLFPKLEELLTMIHCRSCSIHQSRISWPYSTLIDIRSQSKLQFLKRLPGPQNSDQLEFYVTCALKYKDSLSILMLCNSPYYVDFNSDGVINHIEYNRLLYQLDQFTKIQDLILIRHTAEGIESLDEVIEKCLQPKSLKISLYTSWFTDRINNPIIEMLNLDLITPRPTIERVEADLKIHSDNSLLYIIHKFPKVKTFSLNEGLDASSKNHSVYYRQRSSGTDSNVTSTVLSQFLRYATAAPNCIIRLQLKLATIVEALTEYSLLKRRISLTLVYCLRKQEFFMRSCDQDGCLMMEKKHDCEEFKVYCADHVSLGSNYIKIIEAIGSHTSTLTTSFMMKGWWFVNDDAILMANGYCLDYIFQKCRNLTQLFINDSELIHCNPNNMVKSNTITHLTFSHTHLARDILAELSVRPPSLKHLTICQCTFEDLQSKETNDRYVHIDMEDSSFDTVTIQKILAEYLCSKSELLQLPKNFITLVKILTKTGDAYYKFLWKERTVSTIKEYEETEASDDLSKLYLQCESVRELNLILSYTNEPHRVDVL